MIEFISDMLASPLIQRAFIVAVLVGLAAPVVGTYLVQRGLALLGDGIGHIALTGIALGWLAGAAANVSFHRHGLLLTGASCTLAAMTVLPSTVMACVSTAISVEKP